MANIENLRIISLLWRVDGGNVDNSVNPANSVNAASDKKDKIPKTQYFLQKSYLSSANMAEVDFVIQSGMDIVPVEVKSSDNVRARSLAEYSKKYSPGRTIVTSLKNVGGNHIPLYLLWRGV